MLTGQSVRNARLAKIYVAAAVTALLLIGGIFIVPGFFEETVAKKKPLAFGKLRSAVNMAEGSVQSALLAAAGDGFPEPSFEYSWTGGPWPDFPGELAVYRRRSSELTLVQAKSWAAKFGLSGEPQPDQGFIRRQSDGASVPGIPPTEPPEANNTKPQPAPAVEQTEPRPGIAEGEMSQIRPEVSDTEPLPEERESYVFYDQESGKRLYLYIGAGRFDYHDENASGKIDKQGNGGLSEQEAEKFATDWLSNKGLLPADRTGPFFGPSGVVSSSVVNPEGEAPAISEPQITESPYFEVNFGRRLGSYDLVEQDGEVNQYVISVTVGPNGLILGASGEIPLPLEESDYPLIDLATAFTEVKKGMYGNTQALGVPEPLLAPADTPVRSLPPESAQGALRGMDQSPSKEAATAVAEPGAPRGGTESIEPAPQGLLPANPAPDTPVKPQPITLEVDQVKLAYLAMPSDDGTVFYQPAYVFTGTTPRFYQVAVPAINPTQLQD